MADVNITKEEFIVRFKAHMIKMAGFDKFEDGMTVAEYADDDLAESYWDDPDQRECGPEECAEADISCWGE